MALEKRRHFFVYGEVSRAVQAASSSEMFTQSLRLCKNAIVKPEGGVTNRLGTQLVLDTAELDDLNIGLRPEWRPRLLPAPTKSNGDTFLITPGTPDLFGSFSPSGTKGGVFDLVAVDVTPQPNFFGLDARFFHLNELDAFEDLIDDHEDYLDKLSTLYLLSNGRTTNRNNLTQFGFNTRFYFQFNPSYEPITPPLAPFLPRLDGGEISIEYLQSFDAFTYGATTTSITPPTTFAVSRVGSAPGGAPLTILFTLYNEITNEEVLLQSFYRDSTDVPRVFSASEYLTFTVSDAIPADHVVRVYIASGKTLRSARFLGVIQGNGTADQLIYIGQAVDEGVTFPLTVSTAIGNSVAFGNTTDSVNSYLLSTHLFNDYPFNLRTGVDFVKGLTQHADALAATWADQRLVLGGFRYVFDFTNPEREYGSNRVAFSTLGDVKPRMNLPAVFTNEALSFPVNLDAVNSVYHLVNHRRIMVFTDKGVMTISSRSNESALTTSNISIADPNGYIADPNTFPVVAGNEVYFALTRPSSIMRAQFEREINGYSFFESSLMSKDLFQRGAGFNRLCYTRGQYSTLWCFHKGVQEEPTNIVTGLTLRDGDNRSGAHQHDFGCKILDAISIEGERRDDRIYMLTERVDKSGASRVFIERIENRELQKAVRDVDPRLQYRFYDCFTESIAPRFVGDITLPTVDLGQGNPITIDTVVAHGLTLTDGHFVRLEKNGVTWDAEITASDSTSVDVISTDDCPFSGVVEGLTLIALRDRITVPEAYYDFDIGSSVDGIEKYSTVDDTVGAYAVPDSGPHDLVYDQWFDYAIIGFNYVSEVQSVSYVPPENVNNVDVIKSLRSIDVEFENTRSLLVSGYEPEDVANDEMDKVGDFIYDGLERDYYTGRFNIPVRGDNNRNARVLFRQIKPEPFTILGYEASIDM
jgi:hypothetical protein